MTPASWHKWFSTTVLMNKDNEVQSKILLYQYLEWIELEIPELTYLLSWSYYLHASAMSKTSEHYWIYYDMKVIPMNGLYGFFADILVTLFTVTELHHNESINQKIICCSLILTSFVKVLDIACRQAVGHFCCGNGISLQSSPKIPLSTLCLRSNHSLLRGKALATFQKEVLNFLRPSVVCGMKKSHSSRVPGVNIFWSSLIICELLLWECEFGFCTLAMAATVASLRLVTPAWATAPSSRPWHCLQGFLKHACELI